MQKGQFNILYSMYMIYIYIYMYLFNLFIYRL